MADYYFNGDAFTGSPAGSGTTASPYTSAATITQSFLDGLSDGDTLHFAGTFTIENGAPVGIVSGPTILALNRRLTFRQWEGQAQARFIPAQRASNLSWSGPTSGNYSASITLTNWGGDSGTALDAVVWDYFNNVDAKGRYFGFLAYAGAAPAAAGEWNEAAGTVTIQPPSGAGVPGGAEEYWLVESVPWAFGFNVNSGGNGSQIIGLHTYMSSGTRSNTGGADGYGFRLQNASGTRSACQMIDCEAWDSGIHNFGFVGGGSWSGCQMIRCHAFGCRSYSPSATTHVFYSTETSGVDGCKYDSCDTHLYSLLAFDGTTLHAAESRAGTAAVTGFFAHGNSDGDVSDIVGVNCRAFGYDDTQAADPFKANNAATPSDTTDPDTYAVRWVRCSAFRCDYFGSIGNEQAYDECYFEVGTNFYSVNRVLINLGGNDIWRNSIVVGSVDTTGQQSLFTLDSATVSHRTINCAFHILSAGGTVPTMHYIRNASHQQHHKGSAFSFASGVTGTLFLNRNDAAIDAAAQYNYEGCAYARISAGAYTQNTSFNTEAEWTNESTGIDRLTTLATAGDFGYADTAISTTDGVADEADFTVSSGDSLFDNRIDPLVGKLVDRGRNGLTWSRHAGPNQYGSPRSRNFRARAGGYVR